MRYTTSFGQRFWTPFLIAAWCQRFEAHSRQYFYASAKYFPAQPEHFALVEREADGRYAALLVSNHDSAAEYAENVIAYLRDRPEIGVVVPMAVGRFWILREAIAARRGQQPTYCLTTSMMLRSGSMPIFPKVNVEFLSYIHYTVPPATVKPLPYVVPTYCEYGSHNQFHSITEDRASNANCRRQTGAIGEGVESGDGLFVLCRRCHKTVYLPTGVRRCAFRPSVLPANWSRRQLCFNDESAKLAAHGPHMYAYARAAWDSTTTLDEVENNYMAFLYGRAAEPMRAHHQATRDLFETEFFDGQTGEEILSGFRIKKFDSAREASSLTRFRQDLARIKDSLVGARSSTSDQWVLKRIEVLDQDAQLIKFRVRYPQRSGRL